MKELKTLTQTQNKYYPCIMHILIFSSKIWAEKGALYTAKYCTWEAGKCELAVHPGKKRNRFIDLLAILCHGVPCNYLFLSYCLFLIRIG